MSITRSFGLVGPRKFLLRPVTLGGAAIVALAGVLVARLDLNLAHSLFGQALILSFLALGVGFLIRSGGLVSFGHASPFGIGAYGVAFAFSKTSPLAPEVALLLIVPAVIVLFFLIGLIISRLEGIAFGMLTLALGQGVYVAATKFRTLTGGADGIVISLPRRIFGWDSSVVQTPSGMFLIALFLLVLLYLALRLFEASHAGRLAIAIRENEERTRFLGYRTRPLRAAVYAMSSGIAALGGILFGLYQGFVSPEILHWSFSGSGLIMAILGGTSFLWGPIAGAIGFFFMREWLTELTSHWLAILGTVLIVVTVLWPLGLSGGVKVFLARVRARAVGRVPA